METNQTTIQNLVDTLISQQKEKYEEYQQAADLGKRWIEQFEEYCLDLKVPNLTFYFKPLPDQSYEFGRFKQKYDFVNRSLAINFLRDPGIDYSTEIAVTLEVCKNPGPTSTVAITAKIRQPELKLWVRCTQDGCKLQIDNTRLRTFEDAGEAAPEKVLREILQWFLKNFENK